VTPLEVEEPTKANTSARPVEHPLGPLVFRVPAARPAAARVVAAVVLAGCVALLATAAALTPSETGLGTHQQLGFPPCTFVLLTGYPCPTCGMTTAFSYAVRGQLIAAFSAHPAGLALALATAAAVGICLSVIATGTVWKVNLYRVRPVWFTVMVIGLMAAGWAYKIIAGIISGALPMGGTFLAAP